MSDIEIFELGKAFAEALQGDREAISNLKILADRHPEFFKNIKEVAEAIAPTALEPEIVMPNLKPLGDDIEVIGVKRVNIDGKDKIVDIGVRNENGTNVIFHADKTRISNFKKFEKRANNLMAAGRSVHTSYTETQSSHGRLVKDDISATIAVKGEQGQLRQEFNDRDFCDTASCQIIPQQPAKFEKLKKTFTNLKSNKSKNKDLEQ